jgi:hypothetical protein
LRHPHLDPPDPIAETTQRKAQLSFHVSSQPPIDGATAVVNLDLQLLPPAPHIPRRRQHDDAEVALEYVEKPVGCLYRTTLKASTSPAP